MGVEFILSILIDTYGTHPIHRILSFQVGSAVESAIERFVAVGETIADENPDVQPEMYDACHEARLAGTYGIMGYGR